MIKLIPSIRRVLSGSKSVDVTIDVSQDDWGTTKKVSKALKKFENHLGGNLVLDVIGMNRIHPTAVLGIHDLLSGRPPCVKLHVNVLTNLIDGSLIFPLLADTLHIRKGAWFQIASTEELEKKSHDDEDGEQWKGESRRSVVNTVKEPAVIKDYRAMSSLLSQYLPLAEFKGKRLPLEETLKDFYLLKDRERDENLAHFFKA
jgi:hypothetical protein